jgi:molecular chaperone DnaJ
LIVHIDVAIPGKINKEQAELMRKFAQARNEDGSKVQIHRKSDEGFFSKVRNVFR